MFKRIEMGKEDRLYQLAVDSEMQKIALKNLDWIFELPPLSNHKFEYDGQQYEGGLTYFSPGIGSEHHSIVLVAQRKLRFGAYRKYMAGFSISENKVIPILSKILYSCD